jgi:hypothetical protein
MGIQTDYDNAQTSALDYDEVRDLLDPRGDHTEASEMLAHDNAILKLTERGHSAAAIGRSFGAGAVKRAEDRLMKFYRVYWESKDAKKAAKAAGYL